MGSACVLLIVLYGLGWLGLASRFGVGLGLAIIAYIPATWVSRRIIDRLLPMSSGRKMTLAERRITYLTGLQTAVVGGRIKDRYDLKVLEKLRKRLNISDREHGLLMSGYARERPTELKERVEEVYLFHKQGILIGYQSSEEIEAHDKADLMATMFSAVGDFSSEALLTGSGHLGAIEYGDTTLIMELEKDIALGVLLKGKDNPNVRQRMRDVLGTFHKKYSDVAVSILEGDLDRIMTSKKREKALEDLLRELLK